MYQMMDLCVKHFQLLTVHLLSSQGYDPWIFPDTRSRKRKRHKMSRRHGETILKIIQSPCPRRDASAFIDKLIKIMDHFMWRLKNFFLDMLKNFIL